MNTLPPILIIFFLLLAPASSYAIHDDAGKTKCLDCHETLPFDRSKLVYTETVGGVCHQCHDSFPCDSKGGADAFAHPISVMPSMTIPLDMPLDKTGRITCITCHSYHAEFWDAEYNNESLLRRTKGVKLCYTCHKNFPNF